MAEGAVGTALIMLRNSVTILREKVIEIHHPVVWEANEMAGIKIVRIVDGTFSRIVLDPELGGLSKNGTLDEVLNTLRPEVAGVYRQVFAMVNPTKEGLSALLPGFQVMIQG